MNLEELIFIVKVGQSKLNKKKSLKYPNKSRSQLLFPTRFEQKAFQKAHGHQQTDGQNRYSLPYDQYQR